MLMGVASLPPSLIPSLQNICNECCLTCVVVLMVMLTGYLPEMRNKHLMKLIMTIGIVNFSSEFLVKLLS